MDKISVVINTLNEENNLPRALDSIKGLADEIIVVDMHSDDDTVKIAKKEGAKVYNHKREGYVEPARNFAISKATGDWVLVLDADEELPRTLVSKIKRIIQKPLADYYRLPRKNIIFGKWIKNTLWWPDYQLRLFKKGKVKWSEMIHSVPETRGKGLDLDANIDNAIIHNNYQNLEQFIERLNRYTSIQAQFVRKEDTKFKWTDLIQKPVSEFCRRYFSGKGYKDGLHGLALSILQAFSEFLVYAKVWQNNDFSEIDLDLESVISEVRKFEKDFKFWQEDALLKEVGGLKHRIKRKLKI